MENDLHKKINIAEAATSRYLRNRRFTIQSLAAQMNIEAAEIFDLFPNRSAILDFFYESRLLVFAEDLKQLSAYSEFSLSEKLSNLFYFLLDQFQQHREFVSLTYENRLLNLHSGNEFRIACTRELEKIFSADSQLSASASVLKGNLLYNSIVLHLHGLILFWMNDKSSNYANSMALADKWCSLLEEIFYTKIIDKGFDFGKFLFYQSPFENIMNKK